MQKVKTATAVLIGCFFTQAVRPQPAMRSEAVLLDGAGPWRDSSWRDSAAAMRGMLQDAAYRIRVCSPADISQASMFPRDVLVVAPSLERLPVDAARAIVAHVAEGGSLIATGRQPFQEVLHPAPAGQWFTTAEMLLRRHRRTIADPAELKQHSTPSAEIVKTSITSTGAGEGHTLQLNLLQPVRLEPLEKVFMESPFRAGEMTTIVTVRGTPGEHLTVEWRDAGGVRWLARVPLTEQWRTHALRPSEFSGPPSNSRQSEPPRFDPQSARMLALSLLPEVNTPPVAPVEFGLRTIEVGEATAKDDFTPPVLETLSPWYKQYDAIRDGSRVRVPIARPRGLTAAAETDGRYEVIGSVVDPAATRYLQSNGASLFWLPSPNLKPAERAKLVQLLRNAGGRVGLLNGGAAEFAFVKGEPLRLGARVLNASSNRLQGEVVWTIWSGESQLARHISPVEFAPGETRDVTAVERPLTSAGEYRVETRLSTSGGEDRVEASFRVEATDDRTLVRRLRVQDGHFVYNGKRVFLNGVNYWPRSASGLEAARYWDHWLTPRNYDPEVVEADLSLLERLGFNLVSIQYMNVDQGRPLMDFLERCRKHGIWAHISMNSASNLRLNPERDRALVERAGLANNAAVFGYELAWEPHLGLHVARQAYDESWRSWVTEQYGSVEEAERTWGIRAPRNDRGELTNPLEEQIGSDGPHRVMVAAYRRFVDDLISRTYGKAVRHLRDLDPGALFAVRTGWGGTGQRGNNLNLGYDLISGAAHLDAVCPEGYGMPADFPPARKTGFITAYGLYAGNGKPVCWLEFGASIGSTNGTYRARRQQALLAETTMRVAADSGAEGTVVWWYPGGWRVNERSDFGIVDPDGSPRDSARVISDWARRLQENSPKPADGGPVTLQIDRDADARGLYGMWEKAGADYVRAREENHPVHLATAGTGTSSRTMPLVQVGNVQFVGHGPLKYANAEIGRIRIEWPGGAKTVENGEQVDLPAGGNYQITVSLVNTGEAAWLPGTGNPKPGDCLLHTSAGDLPIRAEVPRFGITTLGPITVSIPSDGLQLTGRVSAIDRGSFGEILRLSLRTSSH